MNYYKKANYTTIVNAQRRAGGGGRLSFNNLNPTQKRSQCDLFLNPPVGTILKEIWQNTEAAGGGNGVLFFTYEGTKHNGHPLWIRNDKSDAEPCGDNEIKKFCIYYDGNNWYQIYPCDGAAVFKYTETKKCLIPQSDYMDDATGVITGFSRFSII
jgi:hypothetical protein